MAMNTILVAVDFSDVTARVVDTSIAAAKAYGAKLVLLHVAAPEPTFVGYEAGPQNERQWRADRLRSEHRQLQELAKSCQDQDVDATALLVPGAAVDKVVDEAHQHDAGMIILGSHGHGAVYQLLVGSVTEGVLKKADRPVLVVPSDGGG